MNRFVWIALALALPFVGASAAHALHCNDRVVDVGYPASRVRSLCGEPTELASRVETRSIAIHRRGPGGIVITDAISVSVLVETWLYDFGPERFMRELTFEDGQLRAIATLGYGTVGRGRAQGKSGRPKVSVVFSARDD